MTVIIGILCDSGIVVGADGASTLGDIRGPTVSQNYSKKIEIIDKRVIFSSSGHVGLAQRLKAVTEKLWRDRAFVNKNGKEYDKPAFAMHLLRIELWNITHYEFDAAKVASSGIGPNAFLTAHNQTLIALPVGGKLCLFTFDEKCAPEMATENIPFVSIGSGQPIADPFLGFLRRIFWNDTLPSLADGIFATVWTLNHAIALAPGGISDPKQIAVIENGKSGHNARILKDEDLQEHQQSITRAEDALRNSRISKDLEQGEELPLLDE